MSLLLFLPAALALLVMPGPTNLLLAGAAERHGLYPGLRLLPAVVLAYACGIAFVTAAIALFPRLPLAPLFRLAAVVWLIWLSVRLWRRPERAAARAGGAGVLFATTLTNPKVVVFATLLIPPGRLLACLALLAPLIAAAGAFYLLLGAGLVRLRLPQRVLWRSLAAMLLAFAGMAAIAATR